MNLPDCLRPQALRLTPVDLLGYPVEGSRRTMRFTDWLLNEGLMQMAPKSHRSDPHTSYEAAQKAAGRAKAVRTGVLLSLSLYGPQTADEMAQRVNMKREDVARRCSELLQDGKICRKETGTHDGKPVYHTRQTPTGSNACVWYLV